MLAALDLRIDSPAIPPASPLRTLELVAVDPASNSKTRIVMSDDVAGAREALAEPMQAAIYGADGRLLAVLGIASISPGFADRQSATVARPQIELLAPSPATPDRREQPLPRPAQARGGLPPKALRRVREYIDAHLEESICLKDLASIAGLSMFHFARAFKQSQGQTPNCYLFQRRVERARELLADSDLPLCEIAVATGFSDQSHFARRFREHIGTTPAKYRWSKR